MCFISIYIYIYIYMRLSTKCSPPVCVGRWTASFFLSSFKYFQIHCTPPPRRLLLFSFYFFFLGGLFFCCCCCCFRWHPCGIHDKVTFGFSLSLSFFFFFQSTMLNRSLRQSMLIQRGKSAIGGILSGTLELICFLFLLFFFSFTSINTAITILLVWLSSLPFFLLRILQSFYHCFFFFFLTCFLMCTLL